MLPFKEDPPTAFRLDIFPVSSWGKFNVPTDFLTLRGVENP